MRVQAFYFGEMPRKRFCGVILLLTCKLIFTFTDVNLYKAELLGTYLALCLTWPSPSTLSLDIPESQACQSNTQNSRI